MKKHKIQPVSFESPDDAAMRHAWDWFSLHAAQRMQSINLLLVSSALLLAGYGVAFQSRNYVVATVIAIAGVAVVLAFAGLDVRNRHLVRAGEAALRPLQDRLANQAEIPELRILDSVESPKPRFLSYSFIVRALAIAAIAIFAASGVAAAGYAVVAGVPASTAKTGLSR